jgi:hypothetical protein
MLRAKPKKLRITLSFTCKLSASVIVAVPINNLDNDMGRKL